MTVAVVLIHFLLSVKESDSDTIIMVIFLVLGVGGIFILFAIMALCYRFVKEPKIPSLSVPLVYFFFIIFCMTNYSYDLLIVPYHCIVMLTLMNWSLTNNKIP